MVAPEGPSVLLTLSGDAPRIRCAPRVGSYRGGQLKRSHTAIVVGPATMERMTRGRYEWRDAGLVSRVRKRTEAAADVLRRISARLGGNP